MKLIVHSWDKKDLVGIIQNFTEAKLGAEIGVFTGMTSEMLLRVLPTLKMYLIDPYRYFLGDVYKDPANSDQAVQDARYEYVCKLFDREIKFGKCEIFRLTSAEAAPKIADNSLDFAYIDANHSYEYVKQDINLWWPKVKENGILAGHDYTFPEIGAALTGSSLYDTIHWLKADDSWVIGKGRGMFL